MSDWAKEARKPINHPVRKIIDKAIDECTLYGSQQYEAIAKYFSSGVRKVWIDDVLIEAEKMQDFINSWADSQKYSNMEIPVGINTEKIRADQYEMFSRGYHQAVSDIARRFSKFYLLLKFYEASL